jgi:hypothetical protein
MKKADFLISAFSVAVMIVFFLALYKNVTAGGTIANTGVTPAKEEPQSTSIWGLYKSAVSAGASLINPFKWF